MGRIVIDRDVCKGCYICINACPKGLLKKSNERNEHGDYPVEFTDSTNSCIGCAMCAQSCPDVAIKEVYR
ncbi:MAG: 4Fe-4S binding protein [Clostridium sp.]|nr:4Fe-4S binding protein [Clostridium sp.]